MADNKKGLLKKFGDAVKDGVSAVGDFLKKAPVTGHLYRFGVGIATKVEKWKTASFKVEIDHMLEKMKTAIIDLFKKLSESLNKQAEENGRKALSGELDKKIETAEVAKIEGPQASGRTEKAKDIVKEASKETDKVFGKETEMNRSSDLSKTLGAAKEKAAPGLEVAGGTPGLETPGLDIGKSMR